MIPNAVTQLTFTFPQRKPAPITSAIGIVIAMVKTPQGLFASAWTTTSASTASRMIMIASTLINATAPTPGADFFLHHLSEGFSTATHGSEEHDHIVHAAAERCADQNPERAGQKSELRRQHRPNQRSRSRDGSEVVTENHPAICRDKIFSVILHKCRGSAFVIENENFGGEPFGIETVADSESAQAGDNDPECVN